MDETYTAWDYRKLAKYHEQLGNAILEENARLKAERDTSVAVTERIKVALRIKGTGSYVEWASRCRDALDKLERAEAELAETRRDLQFIERWANHHGQKPNITPREVLSIIQHYPPILEITRSYEDGKVPDTPNPWAELAKLRRHAEAMAEHWEKDDTMNMMQSAVDAYRRDFPEETK